MGSTVVVVIGLVLAAAVVGALGLVLLRKANEAEPPRAGFSLALLWFLICHRPVWAAGLAALVASFALQITALAHGPVSLVQLVVVMELPAALILAALILGGRLHAREWTALTAMTVGVTTLLLSLSPTVGDLDSVTLVTWLLGLAGTAVVVAAALGVARWTRRLAMSTAMAGVAAGVASGMGAVLVKAISSAPGGGLSAVIATWQTWMLLVVGTAGFFLLQNALQAGRLVASQPGITLANPLIAAVWGVGLLGEQVRSGWWLAGAGVGAALLVAGVIVLAGSPLLEGHHEAPDAPPADAPAPDAVNAPVSMLLPPPAQR